MACNVIFTSIQLFACSTVLGERCYACTKIKISNELSLAFLTGIYYWKVYLQSVPGSQYLVTNHSRPWFVPSRASTTRMDIGLHHCPLPPNISPTSPEYSPGGESMVLAGPGSRWQSNGRHLGASLSQGKLRCLVPFECQTCPNVDERLVNEAGCSSAKLA